MNKFDLYAGIEANDVSKVYNALQKLHVDYITQKLRSIYTSPLVLAVRKGMGFLDFLESDLEDFSEYSLKAICISLMIVEKVGIDLALKKVDELYGKKNPPAKVKFLKSIYSSYELRDGTFTFNLQNTCLEDGKFCRGEEYHISFMITYLGGAFSFKVDPYINEDEAYVSDNSHLHASLDERPPHEGLIGDE